MSIATPLNGRRAARRHLPLLAIALVCGGCLVAGAIAMPRRALSEALVAGVFTVTLPLGAALFAAIGVAVGARWWHPLHEVFEDAARLIVVPAMVLAVVLLVGAGVIYPWTDPEVAATHAVHAKHAWLQVPFFQARAIVVLVLWVWMVHRLSSRISRAFSQPSPQTTRLLARSAIIFALCFGLSISVAWWDWLMSLEPEWFSTMQGVYGFANTLVGGIALVTLVALSRERRGVLSLTDAQTHDLGKMLFAFSFFWGYIWFCQFMLIWYANIPEEGGWFIHRLAGGWTPYFLLNGVFGFVLPFILLMSAAAKIHRPRLLLAVWIVIAGRAMDIWMSVAPSLEPHPMVPVFALATLGLILALTLMTVRRRSERLRK